VKVFFDECVPRPLRALLTDHEIKTAQEMNWGRLKNGELIQRAEESGFDVFVTSDQNLRYQQNLGGRRMAMLILSTNYWPTLREQKARIHASLTVLKTGQYLEVTFRSTQHVAQIP
jgi:hypothetical protein